MPKALKANRVIILTAIGPEYKAVRAYLRDLHEDDSHQTGTLYEVGKFTSGAVSWDVLIAQIGMGNPNAASQAERAITHFGPKYALFVGVAGGCKDVALGDVVAATKVYGYEFGKAKREFEPRSELFYPSNAMISRAKQEAARRLWLRRIRQRTPNQEPKAFVGPIAAGEKIVASQHSDVAMFIRSQYGDAVAVEMEGFGFHLATQAHQSVHALVVLGISDLLDGKTEADAAGFQDIAARHAAAFAFACLAKLKRTPITPARKPVSPKAAIIIPGAEEHLTINAPSITADEPLPASMGIRVITDNWLLQNVAELLSHSVDPLTPTGWYAVDREKLVNGPIARGAVDFACLASLIEQIVFCDTIYVMSGWTGTWQGRCAQLDLILPLIREFRHDESRVKSAADRYVTFLCRRKSVASEHELGMAGLRDKQPLYSGQIINGSVGYLGMSEINGYAYNPHPLRAIFLDSALYGLDNWRGAATRTINHLVNDSRLRLVECIAPGSSFLKLGCRISSIAMVCLHESSDQAPPLSTALQMREEPEFKQLRGLLHEVEMALATSGGIAAKKQIDLLRYAISEVETNFGFSDSAMGHTETDLNLFSLQGHRAHTSLVTRLLDAGTCNIGPMLRKLTGTADPNLLSDLDFIMRHI